MRLLWRIRRLLEKRMEVVFVHIYKIVTSFFKRTSPLHWCNHKNIVQGWKRGTNDNESSIDRVGDIRVLELWKKSIWIP